MEKPKTIDAVRMVRQIRDAHYEALKGKSREDRVAFYNSKAGLPSQQEVARGSDSISRTTK